MAVVAQAALPALQTPAPAIAGAEKGKQAWATSSVMPLQLSSTPLQTSVAGPWPPRQKSASGFTWVADLVTASVEQLPVVGEVCLQQKVVPGEQMPTFDPQPSP